MSIPFTQPYTAPDGTKRRPLAERVPECVPKHCGIGWVGGRPDQACLMGERDESGAYYPSAIPASVLSALWRVAVEDWLLGQSKCRWINIEQHASYVVIWRDGRQFAKETMADALNAAAHAVADALGVPK